MEFKKSALSLIIFLLLSFSLQAKEADFNEICTIYTEVLNSNMDYEKATKYINDNISFRISDKHAISLHSAIPLVAPKERYTLFKESAQEHLKMTWDCSAMKIIMSFDSAAWQKRK